ncbi:uncharacterized protein N7506_002692 [Penicillium brevicompactum]|uniref:uncharacterized protein n=1 Tax=Penicillium brevicompactum TaxID=5074 RepID=UPI002541CD3A|nr:uncharacterized protein N7506_002692 [Penicillium brevicompactum]KAJ5344327.1 hypothetical protein N7506_002692 [Penicillium brevicompactum]
MADTQRSTAAKRATRNSLSCAQCRYKHLRCDGQKPACSRCAADAKQCVYPESRRRGNPKQKPSQPPPAVVYESSVESSLDHQVSATPSSSSIATSGEIEMAPNLSSHLLRLYYSFFHAAHPCTLPCPAMKTRLADPRVQHLLQVMCYVGSIFDNSGSSSEIWSQSAHHAISQIRTKASPDPFDVQALLLYAIAIYWCNEPEYGVELLNEVIRMAVTLGMNKNQFAKTYGEGNAVVEESWRRTWWVIYITDAHIAGSTHVYPFRTSGVEITTDLPCEEEQYERQSIPPPRSLDDYENREFLGEEEATFSSYAELIGLTLGIDRALSPGNTEDDQLYKAMAAGSDTSVQGWFSLLSPSKRDLIRPDGSFDEVMFKALFIMHTYAVEIHRPLSALTHSGIESVSRCAPLAPSDRLKCNDTKERDLHTLKCTTAIDGIVELLTLPSSMTNHSPFIICMIANVTIAHLSACRFLYSGEKRSRSREKIRLTMGTLKRLSEHWTLGKRTYHEIGIIAREVLSLTKDPPVNPGTVDVPVPHATSLEIPAFEVFSNPEFDFCTLFDAGIPSFNELNSQFVVE